MLPPSKYHARVRFVSPFALSTPARVAGLRRAISLMVVALLVRVVGALMLGEGAPFGPDGTGSEASVFLSGHPYPLHIGMLRAFSADARALSMFAGSLSCVLLWVWGNRVGLGGAGGWLAAVAPLSVLPGVLAAGDAPALMVALFGAVLASGGGLYAVMGGALAGLCVAVKPIALPALVLLLVRPISLLGLGATLLLLRQYTRPIWSPMTDGGLLGTWWVSSKGAPPQEWLTWVMDGASRLSETEGWGLVWLIPLAAMMGVFNSSGGRTRWVAVGPLCATIVVCALFGARLELRYLSAAFVVSLPFLGLVLKSRKVLMFACIGCTWPTLALMSQLGAERSRLDSEAHVPDWGVVGWPRVDARPLFDACSTEDATRLRKLAFQLAEVAPEGSTIITEPRPDGREGELFWPLRVLRPDLKMAVQSTSSDGGE